MRSGRDTETAQASRRGIRVELASERKIRARNTVLYRVAHWPIWIWVFFLAPGR